MSEDTGLQRKLFRTAHSLGVGDEFISLYDSLTGWTSFDIDDDIRTKQLSETEKKCSVLIPVIQGHAPVNAYRHCILSHAFRTRGYEPIIIQCHSGLDLCLRKEPGWTDDSLCTICRHFGAEMFDAFGLEYLTLDSILEDVQYPALDAFDDLRAVTYAGVDVSQFALATLRKFHRRFHVEPTGEHEATYRRFLRSALALAAVTNAVIQDNDVQVALGNDDKYIYGGVPLAVSAAQGVPAYSHSLGYQDQTMLISNISHRSSFPQYERTELVDAELQVPLTGEQSSQIDELMSGRASGETARHVYSSTSQKGVGSTHDEVVAGMFTNLIWDASLEEGDGLFADVFNWIETTIESAANCDTLSIVVKCHPAEAKRGTNESVSEWIQQRFDPLPENVEVLPPDTDVDTYQMISELDVGFVYNSTVGLEMAYEGVPVVVGGDTHYSGLGFTFDPEDVHSYAEVFDELKTLEMNDNMKDRARRYAYFLFFQKHHPFDFYQTNQETLETELLPVTNDDVGPGSDTFDFIVDQCLNGDPVFYSRSEDASTNRRMNTTLE